MLAASIGRSLTVAGLLMLAPTGAFAQTEPPAAACSAKAVRATGGSSVLEGVARSKARSAWMRRVRAKPKLGLSYAAWLRARQPNYACKRTGKRFICEASAIPCKI